MDTASPQPKTVPEFIAKYDSENLQELLWPVVRVLEKEANAFGVQTFPLPHRELVRVLGSENEDKIRRTLTRLSKGGFISQQFSETSPVRRYPEKPVEGLLADELEVTIRPTFRGLYDKLKEIVAGLNAPSITESGEHSSTQQNPQSLFWDDGERVLYWGQHKPLDLSHDWAVALMLDVASTKLAGQEDVTNEEIALAFQEYCQKQVDKAFAQHQQPDKRYSNYIKLSLSDVLTGKRIDYAVNKLRQLFKVEKQDKGFFPIHNRKSTRNGRWQFNIKLKVEPKSKRVVH